MSSGRDVAGFVTAPRTISVRWPGVSVEERYISRVAIVKLFGTDPGIMNEALKTGCENGVIVGCGSHRCRIDGFLVAKRRYQELNINAAYSECQPDRTRHRAHAYLLLCFGRGAWAVDLIGGDEILRNLGSSGEAWLAAKAD